MYEPSVSCEQFSYNFLYNLIIQMEDYINTHEFGPSIFSSRHYPFLFHYILYTHGANLYCIVNLYEVYLLTCVCI